MKIMQSYKFRIFLLVFLVSCGFKNTRIAQEFKAVELQTLEGHSNYVTTIAFSPDGNYLASGSDDHTVKLWQLSGSKFSEIQTLEHSKYINRVVFSPDGNYLASGSDDHTIKLWRLSGGKFDKVQTLKGHSDYVKSVAFSPDGNYLTSASRDATVKLWVAFRR